MSVLNLKQSYRLFMRELRKFPIYEWCACIETNNETNNLIGNAIPLRFFINYHRILTSNIFNVFHRFDKRAKKKKRKEKKHSPADRVITNQRNIFPLCCAANKLTSNAPTPLPLFHRSKRQQQKKKNLQRLLFSRAVFRQSLTQSIGKK